MEAIAQARRPIGLYIALAVLYAIGACFYLVQNQPGQLGGPITVENALWLTYALGAWFVIPFVAWRDSSLPPALRRIYGLFFAGFVVRALVEAYLLWGPKAWIPPYGIAHDGLMIALVLGVWALSRGQLGGLTGKAKVYAGFLVTLVLALAAEMLFAWMFYVAVDFRTDFLWFADYSARFATLNPLMRIVAIAVHVDLGLRLWRLAAPTPDHPSR